MKIFKNITEKDDFIDFEQKQLDDDQEIKKYFENCTHKQFISGLMHLGTLIDIMTTYLDFLKPQIDEAIKLDGVKRDRKRYAHQIHQAARNGKNEYRNQGDIG